METVEHLGQYFTTHYQLKRTIFSFILNEPELILEPCIGRGDLVRYISYKIHGVKFDMFEIDPTIKFLRNIKKKEIIITDFLEHHIDTKYKTIIGNPPYHRIPGSNLYLKFIEKCFNLLQDKGELIFIVPSDFLKLTGAIELVEDMLANGTFTHIYRPNDEKMFPDASVDIMIFRYCKDKGLDNKIQYNKKLRYLINTNGLITFCKDNNLDNSKIGDHFDIYVGLVSAKEKVFKNELFGNIKVLNKKDVYNKYIYISKFPTENKELNKYLLENKDELLSRRIRSFTEHNWFEWGALRNTRVMEQEKDKECIYVYNLTRKDKVAFIGKVGYFGGGLIMMKPKTNYNIKKMVKFLNSKDFRLNFTYSGRFKIGQRQLYNSLIV